MTPEKLNYYKQKLLDLESEILENIQGETTEEENPFEIDGDMVDHAEAINSASVSEGLSSSQKKVLDDIRRAIQRAKDNVYGRCTTCGQEIEEDRLEAIPYAEKCKKHMGR